MNVEKCHRVVRHFHNPKVVKMTHTMKHFHAKNRGEGSEELAELRENWLLQLCRFVGILKICTSLSQPKGCKINAHDTLAFKWENGGGAGGGRKSWQSWGKRICFSYVCSIKYRNPVHHIYNPKVVKKTHIKVTQWRESSGKNLIASAMLVYNYNKLFTMKFSQ